MSKFHYSFVFAIFFLLASCDSTKRSIPAQAEPIQFTILQINDVYEIAPLEGGKVGGLARVAGLLRQLESENPNTIAVMAGDFLSPSFMGTLKMEDGERIAGLQMVEALNAMGLDYATFGNHEFDLKTGELLEKRLGQSDFKYLCANAFHNTGSTRRPFTQNGQEVPDYIRFPVEQNGQTIQVALVGVVLPFNKIDYVHYTDVEDAFANSVAEARKTSEVVLGLTHLSVEGDEALAAAVPGLPLFMGGHEHHHLSRYVGETAITKADANAKTAYVHRITYYPGSKICRVVSELVPINSELPEDPATAAVVKKWQDQLGGLVESMGYNITQQLTTLTQPLVGSEGPTRNTQTNYGLLTNKSIAAVWPGADAYVFNSGSLRLDDNLSGTITSYDILRSFPYGGPVVRVTMKGEVLQQLLQTGDVTNHGDGGYLQRYLAESKGGKWLVGDEPILPQKEYLVVMPEFLSRGLEANLDFLADLPRVGEDSFAYEGETVKNDIRDIIIAYLASGK